MRGTYLITSACYGSHLPGQEGIVDLQHNQVGARTLAGDPQRLAHAQASMADETYHMDAGRRTAVLKSIQDLCIRRSWRLLAAHVRCTHLHIVVEADRSPEQVMTA